MAISHSSLLHLTANHFTPLRLPFEPHMCSSFCSPLVSALVSLLQSLHVQSRTV